MQTITVEELKTRIDAGEKINLIDVREPHEYAEFNLGGKLIPLGKIQTMQTDELDDLKDEEIIIHCRSGQRSMMACLFLDTLGFKNTKNLAGGILAWQELGFAGFKG
ncbi:MAG: rhodanese-like domain-containing protein [Sphingobacteriales bacterium]|nr:rhodanese-like domain-containing protein [Sphingobacteriales bacterium]